jgi:putative ABC transport system permease protein
MRRDMADATAEGAPNFLFLDVPSADAAAFAAFLNETAPGSTFEALPMLRGRVTAVDGVPASEIDPSPEIAWVLRGDRGLTYASEPGTNTRLVAGEWWPADYAGPPLLSLDTEVADGLGLAIGDTVTLNVLGREITTTIANLREIEWQSFGINFFFVLSPEPLRAAPHVNVVSLTLPGTPSTAEELALLAEIGAAYPAVTAMRVKETVERVNDLIRQISWAILGASSITILTAILVLAGALAAGHHRRLYDAVILKTLGATRRSLLATFAAEYLLLGLATAVFGLAAGALVAWYVVVNIMETPFSFLPLVALAAVAAAVLLTLVLGLAGTWRVLGQKAAPVLRSN